MKNVIRVRKADVRVDTWVKPDGLELCLDQWADWMQFCDTDLGVKNQSTLRGSGDGYGNDDTGQARRDREIAMATDAMISDLRSHHRWAIHKLKGLATAWRFPHLNFIEVATEAKKQLETKLRKNVATATLFG